MSVLLYVVIGVCFWFVVLAFLAWTRNTEIGDVLISIVVASCWILAIPILLIILIAAGVGKLLKFIGDKYM